MRHTTMKNTTINSRLLLVPMAAMILLLTTAAFAAAPGITPASGATDTFFLIAQSAYITQPDGQMVYSWGYGCNGAPGGFLPATTTTPFCNGMQVPGPTLIVTEGHTITVVLKNSLPNAAGLQA